jgi:hypothetical protein
MTPVATLPGRPFPPTVRRMTVKLVVLYTHPDDAEAFDRHYLDVHMPLVGQLPGLLRAEAALVVTELYFASQAALGAAFSSAEGKATAADYQKIAPPGSRMFVARLDD